MREEIGDGGRVLGNCRMGEGRPDVADLIRKKKKWSKGKVKDKANNAVVLDKNILWVF